VAGWQIDGTQPEKTDPPILSAIAPTHESVVRRFYDEVLNQGQILAMPYLFAEQVIYQACDTSPTTISATEFTQSILAEQQHFPDLIYTIEHIVVDGNRVSVSWSAEGRPATGEKVTWFGLTMWQVVNGKIVAGWSTDTRICHTE
jgi:predicted ester cyclase